jgi:putative transposase
MPARNVRKTYAKDAYYHVYNRGVEKRKIFLDEQDHKLFLHLLKIYLSPLEDGKPLPATRSNLVRLRPAQSIGDEVKLIAYCLMPNHFHLLLKQQSRVGMTKLMRKLATTHAMYFNEKYKREGSLFQSTYKAVHIDSENYLLHLSRYIHLNPLELKGVTLKGLSNYPYSSYPVYLGRKNTKWLDPTPILSYFTSNNRMGTKGTAHYQDFVEDSDTDSATMLGSLTLE